MGLALGFASMNFHSILTDLFGASLMSGNPHQEVVDKYDVRRHGGGMGVWLGIWTWCFIGSLGLGFLIGAVVIDSLNPGWGFYFSIMLVAMVLLLNIVCPEVRRSPFRRSVAEVGDGNQLSRRIARGEVMMHRVKDGPKWWGQEVYHGIHLSLEMLRQPGFLIMVIYTSWIYAQVVLIITLLGSLTSRLYMLRSPFVGLSVFFVSLGALVAIPFQSANLFSRMRHHQEPDTLERKIMLTSHLVRRAVFCIALPLVGVAYTMSSGGPPVPIWIPVILACLLGMLSGLAISECNGLIMETFDTSDLQTPTGRRPRSSSSRRSMRTNYSSFPRVTAGFAVCHTLSFIMAAVATAVGGEIQRNLGQRAATGVVAGILFLLTLLLLAVLIRFKEVQIIPNSKELEMAKWTRVRSESIRRRVSEPRKANFLTDEEIWRPALYGNPSCKMRRVNILELGHLSRWTEIRMKNKLIDERAAHLNRAALGSAAVEATRIGALASDLVRRVSSRRNNRSSPARLHPNSPEQPSTGGDDGTMSAGGDKKRILRHPHRLRQEPVIGQTAVEENGNTVDLSEFLSSSEDQPSKNGGPAKKVAGESAPPRTGGEFLRSW